VPVIAPGLDTDEKINGAKDVGVDGYTTDVLTDITADGGDAE